VNDEYCKILGEEVGDEEEVFQILWKEKSYTSCPDLCMETCVKQVVH